MKKIDTLFKQKEKVGHASVCCMMFLASVVFDKKRKDAQFLIFALLLRILWP